MKATISNEIYPSLKDMNLCAEVLWNGLVEMPTRFLNKKEAEDLKDLLFKYSQEFKKHREEVVDSCISELEAFLN